MSKIFWLIVVIVLILYVIFGGSKKEKPNYTDYEKYRIKQRKRTEAGAFWGGLTFFSVKKLGFFKHTLLTIFIFLAFFFFILWGIYKLFSGITTRHPQQTTQVQSQVQHNSQPNQVNYNSQSVQPDVSSSNQAKQHQQDQREIEAVKRELEQQKIDDHIQSEQEKEKLNQEFAEQKRELQEQLAQKRQAAVESKQNQYQPNETTIRQTSNQTNNNLNYVYMKDSYGYYQVLKSDLYSMTSGKSFEIHSPYQDTVFLVSQVYEIYNVMSEMGWRIPENPSFNGFKLTDTNGRVRYFQTLKEEFQFVSAHNLLIQINTVYR